MLLGLIRQKVCGNWLLDCSTDKLLALQLAQRVPELSASAYGERDVNFEDIDIWDKDVMDLIDSQDLDRLEDAFGAGQRGDQVEIVQEDDMYVE